MSRPVVLVVNPAPAKRKGKAMAVKRKKRKAGKRRMSAKQRAAALKNLAKGRRKSAAKRRTRRANPSAPKRRRRVHRRRKNAVAAAPKKRRRTRRRRNPLTARRVGAKKRHTHVGSVKGYKRKSTVRAHRRRTNPALGGTAKMAIGGAAGLGLGAVAGPTIDEAIATNVPQLQGTTLTAAQIAAGLAIGYLVSRKNKIAGAAIGGFLAGPAVRRLATGMSSGAGASLPASRTTTNSLTLPPTFRLNAATVQKLRQQAALHGVVDSVDAVDMHMGAVDVSEVVDMGAVEMGAVDVGALDDGDDIDEGDDGEAFWADDEEDVIGAVYGD